MSNVLERVNKEIKRVHTGCDAVSRRRLLSSPRDRRCHGNIGREWETGRVYLTMDEK